MWIYASEMFVGALGIYGIFTVHSAAKKVGFALFGILAVIGGINAVVEFRKNLLDDEIRLENKRIEELKTEGRHWDTVLAITDKTNQKQAACDFAKQSPKSMYAKDAKLLCGDDPASFEKKQKFEAALQKQASEELRQLQVEQQAALAEQKIKEQLEKEARIKADAERQAEIERQQAALAEQKIKEQLEAEAE